MRVITILMVMIAVSGAVHGQQNEAAKYIGYKYAGVLPGVAMPNGVKHLGGGLIGDIDADPVYGISQLEKGRTKMLWLEASTGKNETGVTGWEVKDVLAFPAMKAADYLFFYGDPAISCTRDGRDIPNLVGVGQIIRKRAQFRPSKFWIANLTTKKFEAVPVAGVKCEYSEP